jgi:hypothetical protein
MRGSSSGPRTTSGLSALWLTRRQLGLGPLRRPWITMRQSTCKFDPSIDLSIELSIDLPVYHTVEILIHRILWKHIEILFFTWFPLLFSPEALWNHWFFRNEMQPLELLSSPTIDGGWTFCDQHSFGAFKSPGTVYLKIGYLIPSIG